jgi:hypothetical protein
MLPWQVPLQRLSHLQRRSNCWHPKFWEPVVMLFLGESDHRRFPLLGSRFAVHSSPFAVAGCQPHKSHRSHKSHFRIGHAH